MKKITQQFKTVCRLLTLAAGLLLSQNLLAGVAFTVTPAAVSNTYNGQITLQVTGLSSGQTVVVQKYLDLNSNGVVDAGDWLVQQFNLTDGKTSPVIGDVTNFNVPGDTDTTAGQITAKLNFRNGDFFQYIDGQYLYKVSASGSSATKAFEVTNFPYAQKFTGNVVSNGTSTTVPNAVILLFPPPRAGKGGPGGNLLAGTVANSTGAYSVQAPPGTYTLTAFKSNYLDDFSTAPVLALGSGATISTNLTMTNATSSISGSVVDATTPAVTLPGIFLAVQSATGLLGGSFTDSNGNFNLGVQSSPTYPTNYIDLVGSSLIVHGYLQPNNGTGFTNGQSNVLLSVAPATALFYGRVLDNLGNPLPGIDIGDQDQNGTYQADGYTDINGDYVVAVAGGLADSWQVSVASDSNPTDYIFTQSESETNGYMALSVGEAVQQNFTGLLATNIISGSVKNASGTPFAGVGVYAYATINGAQYNQGNADTDANGNYSLNVANGTWYVDVQTGQGSGNLPSGYFAPQQTVQVFNDNANVNFVAMQGTDTISGSLMDNSGLPIPGVNVYAYLNGQNYNLNTSTDGKGNYSFTVFNGTWTVGISTEGSGSLPGNYLAPQNQSVAINNNNGTAYFIAPVATNTISGFLTDNNGNPIAGVDISAFNNNPINGNIYTASQETGTNGFYSLNVVNGAWDVYVQSGGGIGTLPADYLNPQSQYVGITNDNLMVSFTVPIATNTISGSVRDSNGHPIVGVGVGASATINQQNYNQSVNTDLNGNYSVGVASGQWTISLNCDELSSLGNYSCPNGQFDTISGNNATNNFVVPVCGSVTISQSLPIGEVNVFYNQYLQASSCSPNIFWSNYSGTLPPSVTWNTNNGQLSGVPSGSGTFNFSISVQDGNGVTANQPLSVTIVPAVQVSTTSLPNGNNGTFYSVALQATNGQSPYTWTNSPGSPNLPANLSLSSTGLLSGTPITNGTFNFVVLVTDNLGGSFQRPLSLTVSTVAQLQITTTTLPAATQNVFYTNSLAATGGTPPYTWTLTSGKLPSGLTLTTSGGLAGTPTTNGTSSFTVQAKDSSGTTATQPLTLVVVPQEGSLQVTILPTNVLALGAEWQVDSNGTFLQSGATLTSLSLGSHTVSYSAVSGWTAPTNQPVTITADQLTSITGNYTNVPQVGSLEVTITGTTAGTWEIDANGTFLKSGVTLSNLSVGSHVLSFKAVTGLNTPGNQTIAISTGTTNKAIGAYTKMEPPTLTVSSPKSGITVTNEVLAISGKVTDDVAVASVSYSVNGGVASPATLAGNLTNWSANVPLAVGSNTISISAQDSAGNSATNTLKVFYALAAPLSVIVNGPGTVKPDDNGSNLIIGKSYSMTATPEAGCKLINWSISINSGTPTNSTSTALKFTMAAGMVITANFQDVTKPSTPVISTTPAKGSNSVVTLHGTAKDNVGVEAVYYTIGSGPTNNAIVTSNGYTNWTAVLILSPGANAVQVYAQDKAGNVSLPGKVTLTDESSGFAPQSLSGVIVTLEQPPAVPSSIFLGTSTFAYIQGSNFGVGDYVFSQIGLNSAQLAYQNLGETEDDGAGTLVLAFTNSTSGNYTNTSGANVSSGMFTLGGETGVAPPSLEFITLVGQATLGGDFSNSYTYGTFESTNVSFGGGAGVGSYTYVLYSPQIALLTSVYTGEHTGLTNYALLDFGSNSLVAEFIMGATTNFESGFFSMTKAAAPKGFAPESLAGWTLSAKPAGKTTEAPILGFDTATFGQIDTGDTNDESDVASYVYTRTGPNTGELSFVPISPPTYTNGAGQVVLDFTSSTAAAFTVGSVNWTATLSKATTATVPASLVGTTLSFTPTKGTGTLAEFGLGTYINVTKKETNSYTFGQFGPQMAMLQAVGDSKTNYIVLQFTTASPPSGNYVSTKIDSSGNVSFETGKFKP